MSQTRWAWQSPAYRLEGAYPSHPTKPPPEVLLLDEPTTGLDSFMAEIVVNDLKKLATGEVKIGDAVDQKRTVIATIHQPSSDVFRLFDKLCLLVDGKVVFFGPCSEAAAYFQKLGEATPAPAVWACPDHTNPADFFMRLFVNPADNDNAAERRQIGRAHV